MSSSCTPPEANIIQEELAAASAHRHKETTAGTLPVLNCWLSAGGCQLARGQACQKLCRHGRTFLFRGPMLLKYPRHLLPSTTLATPSPTLATSIAATAATTTANVATSATATTGTAATGGTSTTATAVACAATATAAIAPAIIASAAITTISAVKAVYFYGRCYH